MSETIRSIADPCEQALLALLRHFNQPLTSEALRSRVAKLPGPWSIADLLAAAALLGVEHRATVAPATSDELPLPTLIQQPDGSLQLLFVDPAGQRQQYDPAQDRTTPLADATPLPSGSACYAFQRRLRQQSSDQRQREGRYGHWFFGPLRQARKLYMQVALAAFLINLFAITTSIFSMIVYDRVIPNNATDTLMALLIGAGVVFVSDFIIRTLRGYFLDIAGARADRVIGDTLFEQILDMQLAARSGTTGAVANMLKEFESLREFLTSTTLVTLIDIPFAILFLFIIWSIGGPMVYVPLLAIPLLIGTGLAVQPRLRRLTAVGYEDGKQKHAVLIETLSGLESIKALGAGAQMRQRWQQAVAHQSEIGLQQRMINSLAANMANLAQQLVQVGVVTSGFFLVSQGQIGFGAIIACTILAGRTISPLAQMAQLLTRLNQSLTSYRSLSQLMNQPREHERDVQFLARDQLRGTIEFREVTFRYPGAPQPVLDRVSFRIEAGERVAILGRVGCGKSTIAKLILGLYQPESGAVLMDEVDVRQIDPADLRRHLGVVLQDVWLLNGTLRENIAFGSADADDAAVLAAAKVAGVEDFAGQHPQGYGMRVGERGEGLSGGQRQAVSVARALLGERSLLLLDEPSSAMDLQAEQRLVERLQQHLQPTQTLLVITHKSMLLKLVQRVLVIDQGRVTFSGPVEKVLKSN